MNHTLILKRAWNVLWSYKMLWVFGFLLALTSAGGLRNYNPSTPDFDQRGYDFSFDNWKYELTPEVEQWVRGMERLFSQEMIGYWIGVGIAVLCLLLLVAVVLTILKYVSHVSLIRMVDGHEMMGEKAGFRQGWRLGWSRSAWRLFLIDLAIGLPLALIGIGLFGCASLPIILSVTSGSEEPIIAATLISTGLMCVWSILFIPVAVALGLVINLIRRDCVLGGNGVIDSIKLGVKLFRTNLKDVSVMWLILAGFHIGYTIVIIPVVLLLLGIGLAAGVGAGAAIYFGLQAVASQGAAIATAVILGIFIFFTMMGLPLTFLEGLRLTYFSTTWTLTYRELVGSKLAEVLDISPDLPLPAEVEPPSL